MANEFNKFSGHYVEVNGKVLSENIVKAVPWGWPTGRFGNCVASEC